MQGGAAWWEGGWEGGQVRNLCRDGPEFDLDIVRAEH